MSDRENSNTNSASSPPPPPPPPPQPERYQLRKNTVLQRKPTAPPIQKRLRTVRPPPRTASESDVFEDALDMPNNQPPPPPNGDGSQIPDEVSSALSPELQALLQSFINSRVAATTINPIINIPAIQVRTINQNLKAPQYHPLKKTGAAYLVDLEAYFKSQGLEEKDFLVSLPTVLDEEVKSWYRHKAATYSTETPYTWALFKQDFLNRYDSESHRQRRQQYLVSRKHKEGEPVEAFVWEMMDLAKQVFPGESLSASVERCRRALCGSLRKLMGGIPVSTPEALIERCTNILEDSKDDDRQLGQRTFQPTQRYGNGSFRGRGTGYNTRYQARGSSHSFSRGNGNRGGQTRGFVSNYANKAATTQQDDGQQPSTSSSSTATNPRGGYFNKRQFKSNTRGTFRGAKKTTQATSEKDKDKDNPNKDKKCYVCKKTGHIAAGCPVTAFFMDDERGEEDFSQEETNVNHLNR